MTDTALSHLEALGLVRIDPDPDGTPVVVGRPAIVRYAVDAATLLGEEI